MTHSSSIPRCCWGIALATTLASGALAQSSVPPTSRPVGAAPSPYFTPEDALEVNTFAIADLSDDGKWIALTQTVRRDGFGIDYRHDGDPTYVHPVAVRLWSVDARTGQRQPVFADKRAVRGMKWSPDGSQLAMLIWNTDAFEPAIWNRATGKVATLKMPAGKYVAETASVMSIGISTAGSGLAISGCWTQPPLTACWSLISMTPEPRTIGTRLKRWKRARGNWRTSLFL